MSEARERPTNPPTQRERASLKLAALADEHLYVEKGWVGGYKAFCEAVLTEWPQMAAAGDRPAGAEAGEALAVVNEQAEDEGLWFDATTATEAYLQQALRRVHAAVEGSAGARPAGDREPTTLIPRVCRDCSGCLSYSCARCKGSGVDPERSSGAAPAPSGTPTP